MVIFFYCIYRWIFYGFFVPKLILSSKTFLITIFLGYQLCKQKKIRGFSWIFLSHLSKNGK
jgi:hypothetical protein